MRTFRSADELVSAAGADLGASDWLTIDQHRVDLFADVTEDRQWIHVDPARAAGGPFSGTIAHGFLTLSMVTSFGYQLMEFEVPGALINYGLNKVRFPSPVLVGSRIRAEASIGEVNRVSAGVCAEVKYTVRAEGQDKPVCVAEALLLLVVES